MSKEELLKEYSKIVMKYNKIFDLTNAKDEEDFMENHIEDALLASEEIRKLNPDGYPIFDLGSGCGVPGVPLAIDMEDIPFILVERGSRRADFLYLSTVSLKLDDRIRVLKSDISEIPKANKIKVAVSRALTSFDKVEKDIYELLDDDGVLVLYKGQIDKTEALKFSYFKNTEIIKLKGKGKQRCLLLLRK